MAASEPIGWDRYWRFYWPLTLMGAAGLIAGQLQNATLARYPDAAAELAHFTYATSFYGLLHAALIFVPQLTVVFAKDAASLAKVFRFVLVISGLLTLPLAWLAWTSSGADFAAGVFQIEPEALPGVVLFLRLLLPLVVLDAMKAFHMGRLIRAERTKAVTALNVLYLTLLSIWLWTGFQMGLSAPWTVGAGQLGAGVVSLTMTWLLATRLPDRHKTGVVREPDWAGLWQFFWPVAITSTFFALSRPVIFFFISRTEDALIIIAALRVAFDFSMLFFNPVNQFRNVMVTFGDGDLPGVRRFMVAMLVLVVLVMLLVALTPLHRWVFSGLLGVEGAVLARAGEAFLVLCLVPLAMGFRNYYHGLSMIRKTTRRMGVGSLGRIGAIGLGSWLLEGAGLLDHRAAAALLALGFLMEALVMVGAFRLTGKTTAGAPPPETGG
ncbi:MAG: hypothetical protein EA425_15445 [Puniceicoccaceae bacterium]|nr:MAG: hypothetical protein EA425_15445 [Puniceicoccaceae bacterium]